jgi:glutaconate CoA-transferase subunit B
VAEAGPEVQLVGARGLPDNLWATDKFYYHIRRHTPKHLVDKVDFICALGYGAERDRLDLTTGRPEKVVTDLGVFRWDENHEFIVESLHPGVTLDHVQSQTGFRINGSSGSQVTAVPTREELECIRNVVDPNGWRQIESANAPAGLMQQYLLSRPRAVRLVP